MSASPKSPPAPPPAPVRAARYRAREQRKRPFAWRLFCRHLVDALFHRAVLLLAFVGLVLGAFVLPVWGISPPNCSMLLTMGVPCPSCGLTRATSSALQGYWYAAWQYHPFGFAVAAFFALLGPLFVTPLRFRNRIRRRLRPAEPAIAVAIGLLILGALGFGALRTVLVLTDAESQRWWTKSGTPAAMEGAHPRDPRLAPRWPRWGSMGATGANPQAGQDQDPAPPQD